MEEIREVKAERNATLIRFLVTVGEELVISRPMCIVEYEEWDAENEQYFQTRKEWLTPVSGILEAFFVEEGISLVEG
jgi:hypothetical protein